MKIQRVLLLLSLVVIANAGLFGDSKQDRKAKREKDDLKRKNKP